MNIGKWNEDMINVTEFVDNLACSAWEGRKEVLLHFFLSVEGVSLVLWRPGKQIFKMPKAPSITELA